MRGLLLLAAASSLAAASFEPWSGAAFERARIREVGDAEIYPGGPPRIEKVLSLTLVLFDGTGWREARALRQLRKTAAIFAPCGIGLSGVRLARVRADEADLDMTEKVPGTGVPRAVADLSARAPRDAARPLVFFVGKLKGDSALARSYRRGDVSWEELPRYPYMNTAWVAYKTHWIERSEQGYSSLAHELAHLLCECGHTETDERHLLNSHRNFLGVKIRPADCRRMKNSPLLRPR